MTVQSSMKIAVFGLGSMGYGMAQSLLRAGHTVHGFDVVPQQVERFRDDGGAGGELADIAGSLDAVVVVVLNAGQTEDVLFGDNGVVPRLKDGAVIMSCATVPPEFAMDAEARCAAAGIHYLDAPISGGSVKAAEGRLSVMAAGRPEAFAAARPVLEATAETLTFGMQQGLAPDRFLEVISKCAGTSWMLENRAPHIIDGDYTPHSQVDIWLKDLGIVLDIARANKFSAPIAAAALQQYVAASGMGLGREDDAAVAKVYARNSGQQLPGGGS